MLYTDWHIMKNPRFCGLNIITCIDNVSGAWQMRDCPGKSHRRTRLWHSGKPSRSLGLVTILSDNWPCFASRGGYKKPTDTWTPYLFENELLNIGIELINSRPHHSQTNGNFELFHRSIEEEIHHTTRDHQSTSNITTRDGSIFRLICTTTKPRSRRFLSGRPQKRSRQITYNG